MPISQRRDTFRLLPADPRTRDIASGLYERVADAPIISPHGHVPAELLAADEPFSDPADLFVTSDHYVVRLLHSAGVGLNLLGLGSEPADPREVWRALAAHAHRLSGTAVAYWLEEELSEVLQVPATLTPETADATFDAIVDRLAEPRFRPQSLFRHFNIDVLATTDDPLGSLAHHEVLRGANLGGRVVPTFRPDRYIDPDTPGFVEQLAKLLSATTQPATFAGYLDALRARREHFIRHGAVSTDHGVQELFTTDVSAADGERLFQRVASGVADAESRRMFRGHMLLQMAGMSVEDGLVMTIHPGVFRNHSTATHARFGPDTGHDIPVATTFTEGVRPLLERYGLEKDFHLILFTVDEANYSREIAPLAGFYPSVYIGAPWWFLDAPDAISRFRSAVTETAGFYRGSGFIDDTRSFLSIPVRHDTARRVDSAYLARLVVEGRITLPAAERIAADLVDAIPREAFKL